MIRPKTLPFVRGWRGRGRGGGRKSITGADLPRRLLTDRNSDLLELTALGGVADGPPLPA